MKSVEYKIIISDQGTATLQRLGGESQRAKGHIHALTDSFGGLKSAILELGAAYAGLEGMKESLKAFTEERNELVKLTQVYKDNSANTKLSLSQLTEIAEKQENLTGIHKDQTEQVEVNLLKHKNLKIAYQDLIPVIEDYAKTSGQDAAGAADTFGRALANPQRAMRVLQEAGVDLTAQEQKHLMVLANMNDTTKAQAELFGLLKDKYKGVAEEMFANDPEAQLALSVHQVEVSFGQLEDELLRAFMPTIKSLVTDVKNVVGWMEKHKGLVEATIKVVGGLIVVIGAYKVATYAAEIATEAWMAIMGESAVVAEMTGAVEGTTAAVEGLSSAMALNPFGLVIAGIAGAGFALNSYLENQTDLSKEGVNEGAVTKEQDAEIQAENKRLRAGAKSSLGQEDIDMFGSMNAKDQQKTIAQLNKTITGLKDDLNYDIQHSTHGEIIKDKQALFNKELELSQLTQKKSGAAIGSGKDTGDIKSASTSDIKGDKHTIITFNIKQFGAEHIDVHGSEEAGRKTKEVVMDALLEAINDSQTTADIH